MFYVLARFVEKLESIFFKVPLLLFSHFEPACIYIGYRYTQIAKLTFLQSVNLFSLSENNKSSVIKNLTLCHSPLLAAIRFSLKRGKHTKHTKHKSNRRAVTVWIFGYQEVKNLMKEISERRWRKESERREAEKRENLILHHWISPSSQEYYETLQKEYGMHTTHTYIHTR